MTYRPKKRGYRFAAWYRRACAAHDRAMAAPMPLDTRYVGERFPRSMFRERYEDMLAAQRKWRT